MKERDINLVTLCPSILAYFGKNHQFSPDSLVLLFSNHSTPRLYSFHKVGGNGGRGRLKKLTIRLSSDEKGHSLEPLDVGGGHVTGALVVPLPLRVERVKLDATTRICHVVSVNGDSSNRTKDVAAGSEIQTWGQFHESKVKRNSTRRNFTLNFN